ncbi:MAG: hypothetical protein HY902_15185 [Deltaproteobacteria bacterium]|nr:hypothetical protein [Deltaproteobacteria bacterium]
MAEQPPFHRLIAQWPDAAIDLVLQWQTPDQIQAYLAALGVDTSPVLRSPLAVLRDRQATPLDGALLACAALRAQGHPPQLAVAFGDDDGLVAAALFQQGPGWSLLQHDGRPTGAFALYPSPDAALQALASGLAGEVRQAIVPLQPLDAQDWMGDDGQLGGLLAAIESALAI